MLNPLFWLLWGIVFLLLKSTATALLRLVEGGRSGPAVARHPEGDAIENAESTMPKAA